MPPKKEQSPLLDKTRELLSAARERGLTNLDIYKATELRPNWVSRIFNDPDYDPSIKRVQKLFDFLSQTAQ